MSYPILSRGAILVQRAPGRSGYSFDYRVHQLVADWFGDREDRGYVYRVLAEDPPHAKVLVLSEHAPRDPDPRPWGRTTSIRSRPYDIDLSVGQVVDYEIRLNATRVVTAPDGAKSRRDIWDAVFEQDPDDPRSPDDVYGEYLQRKLDGAGEVLDARVMERGLVQPRRRGCAPMSMVAANVIGSLRVTDPEQFLCRQRRGIGRGKAFGFGLLCLSRPGTVLARRYGSDGIGRTG